MKKNLLICFDAFGTIFTPRRPIFEQYGEAARDLGLSGFTDEQVASSFKKAFKYESKINPNYGRATGLGAAKWWTNIIHNTFEPLIAGSGQDIPEKLAPTLLHRFSSKEGYRVFEDAYAYLRKHSKSSDHAKGATGRTVIGVITNSDDRVPDILSSLDVKVSNVRHGTPIRDYITNHPSPDDKPDIDFAIMSYDVGFEKPHRRVFDAATDVLKNLLSAEGQAEPSLEDWALVYVGDEVEKDARGSLDAGWDAILMDREGQYGTAEEEHPGVVVLKDFNELSLLQEKYPSI